MNERLHLWVYGRVQGVGFRAFVQRQARQLGLTGWVRNVGDDGVEIVAEGPASALDALCAAAQRGPRRARVDRFTSHREAARGEWAGFHIRASR